MHIYVLTIDPPDGSRRKHCQNLLQKMNYNFTFVEGVLGSDPEVSNLYSKLKNIFFYKRDLSSSEIACYYGFRKIWKLFLETGDEVCLILEDDFNITHESNFKKALLYAHDSKKWDILKLFDYKQKKITIEDRWHDLTIVDYKYPASGCVAYLITRVAANKLLSRGKIFRPVDEDFSSSWELGIRVRSIIPNPVEEASHSIGGSTLEQSRIAKKNRTCFLRSIWGLHLQVWKQIRAFFHQKKVI